MPTDALPPEVQRELDAIDAALSGRPVDPELTALGALAVALREERPAQDPQAARRLDARVAAGFARPPRPSRLRSLLRRPQVLGPLVAAALLAIVVVPAALTGRGGDDAGSASSGDGLISASGGGQQEATDAVEPAAPSGAARAKATPQQAVAPAPVPPAGGGSPLSDRRQARKVERSASMTLVAKPAEIDTVADRIVQTADANRGFVVSSSVGTFDGGEFLLRVPTARLDTVLAQLSRLAHVRDRRQQTEDITAQHTSARHRLQDARAERRSLLRRLARAVTDAEVISLKAQLRDVGARIAAAKTDLARVGNRASFANVVVSLAADPQAAAAGEDGRWSPGDAAKDAVRVLEVAAGVLLIALAVGLPLGLVALAGMLAVRRSARRGRDRALDAA